MIVVLKGFFKEFNIGMSKIKISNFDSRQFLPITAKFSDWGSYLYYSVLLTLTFANVRVIIFVRCGKYYSLVLLVPYSISTLKLWHICNLLIKRFQMRYKTSKSVDVD